MSPRDQEERRPSGSADAVVVTARDLEIKRIQPAATLLTPATAAVDAESARLAAGQS